MAQDNREGFYTQVTKGFKTPIVERIKSKKRTIKYFLEGIYYLSESDFKKVFDLIDKAHENAA